MSTLFTLFLLGIILLGLYASNTFGSYFISVHSVLQFLLVQDNPTFFTALFVILNVNVG